MGEKNSSETRVRPVFNELLDRHYARVPASTDWLRELWRLAAREGSARLPDRFGTLLEGEAPRAQAVRVGRVFERKVAPPLGLLEWLLDNPEELNPKKRPQPPDYGCTSPRAKEWRRTFFNGTAQERIEARDEARQALARSGASGSFRKAWAFEGFTSVDCCLMTDTVAVLVEGKRTESVSTSVLWYPKRNQLWRNVEAAQTLAAGREYGVVLGVESDDAGREHYGYPRLSEHHAPVAEARGGWERALFRGDG